MAHPSDQIETISIRQPKVENNRSMVLLHNQGFRTLGRARQIDDIAGFPKAALDELADRNIILNDENTHDPILGNAQPPRLRNMTGLSSS